MYLQREEGDSSPTIVVLPGVDDGPGRWRAFCDRYPAIVVEYFDWPQLLASGFGGFAADVSAQVFAGSGGRAVQLVGYSMGGALAMACARDLEALGIEVVCLVLLDAIAEERPRMRTRGERLRGALGKLGAFDVASIAASILAGCLLEERLRPMLLWWARRPKVQAVRPSLLDRYVRIRLMQRLYWRWWWESVLDSGAALRFPVLLFRSETHSEDAPFDLGWQRICEDLTVIPVPVSHHEMVGPEVSEVLRSRLDPILAKAAVEGAARA